MRQINKIKNNMSVDIQSITNISSSVKLFIEYPLNFVAVCFHEINYNTKKHHIKNSQNEFIFLGVPVYFIKYVLI
jgi:hypothetical protein